MIALCERFGTYRTYADDVTASEPFAPEVPQRYDAAANFLRSGGRFGRLGTFEALVSRTNYFRATYAYEQPEIPGIEPFLHFEGFVDAARALHERPLVVPNIVYANCCSLARSSRCTRTCRNFVAPIASAIPSG